jgi:subtilisin family serine protease
MNKKRGFFWFCLSVVCLFLFPISLLAKDDSFVDKSEKKVTNKMDYLPGEVIVKYKTNEVNFKSGSGLAKVAEIKTKFSLEKKEEFKNLNIEVLKTKNSVKETIDELKKDASVEYAEPNYLRYPAEINTNDTNRGLLWGLDNTGQNVNGVSGTVDKDIDAPAAWNLSEGDGVIVAVIDTGVAYNHPDLINNMWNGSSCKDSSGNFLGGCNHGYDFEDDDKTPLPTTSIHGTHVAGIIAAEKNNSKGVIGTAPKAKIMAIKTNFSVVENIKAIDFAIQNGAKVINASYVGTGINQEFANIYDTGIMITVADIFEEKRRRHIEPYLKYKASFFGSPF